MTKHQTIHSYAVDLAQRIQSIQTLPIEASTAWPESTFQELAQQLFQLQIKHNPVYARFCQARSNTRINGWQEIPHLPIGAFKEFDVTSIPESERTTVFHSSGTTQDKVSRHFHHDASLTLYETALITWFNRHLVRDRPTPIWISLTPPAVSAPRSSLVHMMATLEKTWQKHSGSQFHYVGHCDEQGTNWALTHDSLKPLLEKAIHSGQPVTLFGTAFNYVQVLELMGDTTLSLPPGSRLMETGGYKGRSRAWSREELHGKLERHLGLPQSHIISEYGMSELSSQAYHAAIPLSGSSEFTEPDDSIFHWPPWVRSWVMSPETRRPVAPGQSGLLCVLDLANAWSVGAIQTEDVARLEADGFTLIGRAPSADAKGCSLQII